MATGDPMTDVWITRADLEVARVVCVLVELAQKLDRDWHDQYDQAMLLPHAVQIALAVTENIGAGRGI